MKRKIAIWKKKIERGIYPNCFLCGKPITSTKDLTTEHVRPKSRGGSSDDTNIYCAHAVCNWEKGNMTLSEYVEYLRQKEKQR